MNRHHFFKLLLAAVSVSWFASIAYAARFARIEMRADRPDGIVENDHPVQVTATIQNEASSVIRAELRWQVHTGEFIAPDAQPAPVEIKAGEKREFTFNLALPVPGFADVECALKEAPSGATVSKRTRIGRQPERIHVPLTRQPDFDEFWKRSLAELKAIPPTVEVAPNSGGSNTEIDVFEITMRSYGNARVRGWLEVPRTKGPHPAVIRVPGYGNNMRPVGKWNDMIVFSFNPRGHGHSQDDVPGKPADFWIRGLDDKDTYYYRGAYLDCLRAVDFIASRSDVDPKRIAVWGGSQGGGFAFAMAALDPRITLCAADIPFLCDWVNYFKLTHWPEIDKWIEADKRRTWETTLKTLSYFDTLNLADRIQCPTIMGVGLQDDTCPPTTAFAVFNRIPARKSFRIDPKSGHGLGKEHDARVWIWIRESFGLKQ